MPWGTSTLILVFLRFSVFELQAHMGHTDRQTDGRARRIMRPIGQLYNNIKIPNTCTLTLHQSRQALMSEHGRSMHESSPCSTVPTTDLMHLQTVTVIQSTQTATNIRTSQAIVNRKILTYLMCGKVGQTLANTSKNFSY